MGLFRKAGGISAVLLLVLTAAASAQQQPVECASMLLPCRDYMDSTSPPGICCDPLREAVQSSDLPCLCSLFSNTQILVALGINPTQALLLPQRCLMQGFETCNSAATYPNSSATPGTYHPRWENRAGSIYWTGNLSSSMALLLLGAFILVHL